jgi:hypothetical protein
LPTLKKEKPVLKCGQNKLTWSFSLTHQESGRRKLLKFFNFLLVVNFFVFMLHSSISYFVIDGENVCKDSDYVFMLLIIISQQFPRPCMRYDVLLVLVRRR